MRAIIQRFDFAFYVYYASFYVRYAYPSNMQARTRSRGTQRGITECPMSDAIYGRNDENTVTRMARLIGKADDSLRDITAIAL